jgi:hypothetical protein
LSRREHRRTARAIGSPSGLALVWISLLMAGCGGSATQHTTQQGPQSVAPPDTLAARMFDLAQDTVLTPLVSQWPREEATHSRSGALPADSALDAETRVYRVQLYTTKDLTTAQNIRQEAAKDFKQDVQIDYEVPYYKVRVGSFASPQAAEPLLQEARRLGYRGAWAVRVRVSE